MRVNEIWNYLQMGSWEDPILDHTEKVHSLAFLWFFAGQEEGNKKSNTTKLFTIPASLILLGREYFIFLLPHFAGKPQKSYI